MIIIKIRSGMHKSVWKKCAVLWSFIPVSRAFTVQQAKIGKLKAQHLGQPTSYSS